MVAVKKNLNRCRYKRSHVHVHVHVHVLHVPASRLGSIEPGEKTGLRLSPTPST